MGDPAAAARRARKPRIGAGAASAFAALLLALSAGAQEAPPEPAPLLGFCAPPVVPGCIGDIKAHGGRLRSCAAEADAYVASVFRYRMCLTRETERAVREANQAMAKLRCAQRRGPC